MKDIHSFLVRLQTGVSMNRVTNCEEYGDDDQQRINAVTVGEIDHFRSLVNILTRR
jgi:hypothetical protein